MDDSKYYTLEDLQREYFQIPVQFMNVKSRYFRMNSDTKLLYGVLYDRISLSIEEGLVDGEGQIYMIFTYRDIMMMLCWFMGRVKKALQELKDYGLLIVEDNGQEEPNKHYLLLVDTEY